jgi:methylthioribose-1-phosphate isomerase
VEEADLRPLRPLPSSFAIDIVDQTLLPYDWVTVRIATAREAAHAIRTMQVRGAPLIGATAAYGLALALRADACDASLADARALLLATRPTAVNLRWALDRCVRTVASLPPSERAAAAWREADAIAEDAQTTSQSGTRSTVDRVLPRVSARCDPDALQCRVLATLGLGTATAPIYLAHRARIPVHVWVSETRPGCKARS